MTEVVRPRGPYWLVPTAERRTVADRSLALRAKANADRCKEPAPPSPRVVRHSLVSPSNDVSLPALRFLGQT